jgi:hypothetical protein
MPRSNNFKFDNLAAVLAKEKKTELVTGDPEFKPLEKEIKINWLK